MPSSRSVDTCSRTSAIHPKISSSGVDASNALKYTSMRSAITANADRASTVNSDERGRTDNADSRASAINTRVSPSTVDTIVLTMTIYSVARKTSARTCRVSPTIYTNSCARERALIRGNAYYPMDCAVDYPCRGNVSADTNALSRITTVHLSIDAVEHRRSYSIPIGNLLPKAVH